jgi:hypothetical protein
LRALGRMVRMRFRGVWRPSSGQHCRAVAMGGAACVASCPTRHGGERQRKKEEKGGDEADRRSHM